MCIDLTFHHILFIYKVRNSGLMQIVKICIFENLVAGTVLTAYPDGFCVTVFSCAQ